MRTHLVLSIAIATLTFSACSKKDVPVETKENSMQQDNSEFKIIVSKDKFNPIEDWEFDNSTLNSEKIYYPNKGLKGVLETFLSTNQPVTVLTNFNQLQIAKKLVNPNENQLIVMGNNDCTAGSYTNVAPDLSNNQYFSFANNLAINYARSIITPVIPEKGEFESTIEHEKLISELTKSGLSKAINYDVRLLEAALNTSTCQTTFVIPPHFKYEYDADSQILTFNHIARYSEYISDTLAKFKLKPELAKDFSEHSSVYYMGKLFEITEDKKLSFVKIFFFREIPKMSNGRLIESTYNFIPPVTPIEFRQRFATQIDVDNLQKFSLDSALENMSYKDIKPGNKIDFTFGLENYISPKNLNEQISKNKKNTNSQIESQSSDEQNEVEEVEYYDHAYDDDLEETSVPLNP